MSVKPKRRLAAILGVALLATTLGGTVQAAGLLIADGGFGGVLEIKEHDVKVTINNGIAVTEVNQVFINTENRIVEALYTFPVPKGASVANFSMWIGGKEMIGEVVEKQRARKIYESYKQTRRDPGLLEQVDYKRFEMRIFPIGAGAEQRVRVTYYQELDFDHDSATYVYPLATVARKDIRQRTTGKFALTLEVKSEVPIASMESPSHMKDFVIVSHSPHYYQASLETKSGDLSRDLVIAYQTTRPKTGFNLIASKQSGEDGYFQLTLTAGDELEKLDVGMDYVFIMDISGSMAHDGKLRMSRDGITAFIDALGEQDRFDVIAFNVTPTTLFNELSNVSTDAKERATEFLDSQQARGGTVLRPAITAAYRYHDNDRPLNVVILSDGMTQQTEQRELLQLIAERPAGARVFCVGVGNEVNRPLLKQLADDSGGLAAFVSREDNFQRQAQAFRRKLVRPAATNVKIRFDGASVYDVEPQEVPNLFYGAPIRLYGRYKQSGPVTITIEGEVLGAPMQQSVELSLPNNDQTNPEIERMWAWHRVQRLMAKDRRKGSLGNAKDEIVALCEGYSIASEYASFIVLENDGEYRRWKIKQRNATRIQRDRAARQALRQRLDQMRETAMSEVGPQSQKPQASRISPDPRQLARSADSPQRTRARPTRGADINVSRRSRGGGAIDPLTGMIALGLGITAAAAARRNRRRKDNV